MSKKIKIGIIGGSGCTGIELIKILNRHRHSHVSFIASRSKYGKRLSEVFPSLKGEKCGALEFKKVPAESDYANIDIIFLCLPPGCSMEHVKKMGIRTGCKIIDIGSDFRLKDPGEYKKWYGKEHILPELLGKFTYAIPELHREEITGSSNVANPGCYPTSVMLGLAPLLKSKYQVESIVIDAKSGVSGAGKKLKEMYLFENLNNNFYAYNATGHRHIGEMEQAIVEIAGCRLKIDFTPHLLPVSRGIFSTIYCKIDGSSGIGEDKHISVMYSEFYDKSIFVKYLGEVIPKMKHTIGTNLCLIGTVYDNRTSTLKIFSTIDNLLKGAAGQAVQNMNLMMGLDESEGLGFNSIF